MAACGEASRLASETMALVESIGDPTLTVGLSCLRSPPKLQTGEIAEALRWSQTVIDLADGEPAKGQGSSIEWPLGGAGARVGNARHRPMRPRRLGGGATSTRRVAMARRTDPLSHAGVMTYTTVWR